MAFDKAGWDAGKGNYSGRNPRLEMTEALRDAGVVQGASRDTVINLLGAPDRSSSQPGQASDGWYLGRNDMAPDFLVLTVSYDEDGEVKKVNTTRN